MTMNHSGVAEVPPSREALVPTLKLRRRAVQEHFADEIAALYAQDP